MVDVHGNRENNDPGSEWLNLADGGLKLTKGPLLTEAETTVRAARRDFALLECNKAGRGP